MKKSLLGLALTFGLVGALNAQDVDVLALVTKGKVTSNSAGVTKLSLDDKMQVKGGFYFVRNPDYDFHGAIPSYSYVVTEGGRNGEQATAEKVGIDSNLIVVAKLRFLNNKKNYYLTSYNKSTKEIRSIWAWKGSYALDILNYFKANY